MKLLAKLGASAFVAALSCAFFAPGAARASDQGYVYFGCVDINSSIFEKEVVGIGSSCAVFNRKKVAENRAIEDVETEGEIQCDTIDDTNASFWEAYCQAVCEYNGYEESTGIGMCDYTVTDTDTWTETGTGCLGGKEFNRKEADVQCGCNCRTYVSP